MSGNLFQGWAPAIGGLHVLGGGLGIAFGVGRLAAPTGITQVGGIILVSHGSGTVAASFRTLWHGQVQRALAQKAFAVCHDT